MRASVNGQGFFIGGPNEPATQCRAAICPATAQCERGALRPRKVALNRCSHGAGGVEPVFQRD